MRKQGNKSGSRSEGNEQPFGRTRITLASRPKGVALPISVIVIVAVAAMVLLYLMIFFLTSAGGQMTRAEAEQAYTQGCLDLCGVTKDTLEQGYNTAYGRTDAHVRFRDACVVLGYINSEPSSPRQRAEDVLACLQTCGNCIVENGETEPLANNIASTATSGLNNP